MDKLKAAIEEFVMELIMFELAHPEIHEAIQPVKLKFQTVVDLTKEVK